MQFDLKVVRSQFCSDPDCIIGTVEVKGVPVKAGCYWIGSGAATVCDGEAAGDIDALEKASGLEFHEIDALLEACGEAVKDHFIENTKLTLECQAGTYTNQRWFRLNGVNFARLADGADMPWDSCDEMVEELGLLGACQWANNNVAAN